jgi:predicted metal-binding membrane protein
MLDGGVAWRYLLRRLTAMARDDSSAVGQTMAFVRSGGVAASGMRGATT